MRYAGRSDQGLSRKNNEDSYLIIENPAGSLLAAVADGIGGSKAGEVASRIAVDTLKELFEKAEPFDKDYQVNEFIQNALNQANDIIYNLSHRDEKLKGMGTTVVGFIKTPKASYIFNVGDSRVYACYSDGFIQMSEDHSVLARMKSGSDFPSTAIAANTLTNALGVWKIFRIDINKIQPDYKRILLCSDGLSGYVDKKQIEKIIWNRNLPPKNKVDKLIDLANDAGGLDNCTVIVLENSPSV